MGKRSESRSAQWRDAAWASLRRRLPTSTWRGYHTRRDRQDWQKTMFAYMSRLVGVLVVLSVSECVFASATESALVVRGGTPWGYLLLRKMAKTVVRREREKDVKIRMDVSCWRDERNIEKFCDGECDLLYHRAFPSAEEDALLGKRMSSLESPIATVPLGYAQVAVIVNRANTVQQLTLDQVRALLRMRGADMHWSDLGGTGDIVNCFGESRDSMSRLVIRHACMMLGPDKPTGYYLYRKDFKQCSDAEEVVKKVKGDRNGIGFVLYHGQPLRGLKVVAIAQTEDNQAVDLKDGQIPHEGYPLLEPLVLYLSPDAPAGARELCTFATGPEGAKILKEHGVWPEYELKKVRGELRLKDMQAGKGAPIRVSGLPGGETLARDLAVPYVKAKAVVQVKYREQRSQAESTLEFLDKGELLLTEGEVKRLAADGTSATVGEAQAEGEPPSPPTPLPQTGEGSKEPLPSAASPQGATLGVRAVGVVVHADNGAKELTLEDLRLIYSGEIDKWPAMEGTAGRIRIFGLASGSAAMKLVEERLQGDAGGPHPQPLSRERERGADAAQPSSPAPRPSQPGTRGWSGARIRGRWCCRWPISRGRSGLWI